jgi:PAS domain S-box-containing protein
VHKHLQRQLRRLAIDEARPPGAAEWRELLTWISSTYGNMDRERYLVERSIEISSREMRELNAKIAEERDKFASIFKATPSGMAIVDTSGFVVEVNQALGDMLEYTPDEIIGHKVSEFFDPEEKESAEARIRELASAQVTVTRQHRRFLNRKGGSIIADVQARTIRDADGNPKMILMLVDDVTEKNRLEVELRHSQKLESVGRLAAGIAHEINTPIQFVGDNVSFLSDAFEQLVALCDTYRTLCEKAATGPLSADDIACQKQHEEKADLDYIRVNVPTSIGSTVDGVGRVARIVQSMKAFAHPDRGERSVADINNALHNTLTVATNELKYVANVETNYGEIPAIPCFLSDLNQVFLNLLVNAAHAIGDVVGTSGQRGTIRVRTFMEKNSVVVAISDTGTGIPPAVQGHIFDPFFTTKGVGKGTGQGLALAHSVVVEQHGGTITFETEPGKGTTFFVRIPATLPEEEPANAEAII